MKATDVTQFSLDISRVTPAAENPILGSWKLQSLVFEAIATGQRSSPFGDHPVGSLGPYKSVSGHRATRAQLRRNLGGSLSPANCGCGGESHFKIRSEK